METPNEKKHNNYLLGIDTGGTYTDGVLLDESTRQVITTAKTITTRHDLTQCILKVLNDLLPNDPGQVQLVSISTTLATNAIAEGKGRPVAGSVIVNEDAWIYPQMRGMHIAGYFVQSGTERKRFPKLEPALEFAQEIASEKALARARESGTVDPHLEFEQFPDGAESYRIRAKAVGNPRLMKGD